MIDQQQENEEDEENDDKNKDKERKLERAKSMWVIVIAMMILMRYLVLKDIIQL